MAKEYKIQRCEPSTGNILSNEYQIWNGNYRPKIKNIKGIWTFVKSVQSLNPNSIEGILIISPEVKEDFKEFELQRQEAEIRYKKTHRKTT